MTGRNLHEYDMLALSVYGEVSQGRRKLRMCDVENSAESNAAQKHFDIFKAALFSVLVSYVGKGHGGLYKAQQRKKEESERLRGERSDQVYWS